MGLEVLLKDIFYSTVPSNRINLKKLEKIKINPYF
jgi:hypothetical protein